MTGQERDYDEVLSRVLHSTTDQIEPVGDGLTKIQARLAEPWLKRQWWLVRTELKILGWVLAVRCQSWFSALRSGSAVGADAAGEANTAVGAGTAGDNGQLRSLALLRDMAAQPAKRPRKAGSSLRGSAGPAMTWLRPALAVAGAVVLVVAGVFALAQIRGTFIGLENDNPPGTSTSSHNGGPGSPYGSGTAVPGGASATQGHATSARPGSTPSSKAYPAPAACSTPSPPPPASPTPTPSSASPSPSPSSPSPSPSPTTPTPTPTATSNGPISTATPTATNAPAASALTGGQIQVIKTTALVCQHTANPAP